jgi:hypothetical protein
MLRRKGCCGNLGSGADRGKLSGVPLGRRDRDKPSDGDEHRKHSLLLRPKPAWGDILQIRLRALGRSWSTVMLLGYQH